MSGVNLPHDHGQNIEKVLERMPDVDECAIVADVFKQISDGSRIRILWLLCHCEECVSNIAAAMNMSDPAVSHHLKLLKKSGLIVSRRDGKEIYYKLADTQTANLLHHIIEEMFRVIKISYYVFLYNTHTVVNSISMTEQLICHLLYTPLVPLPLDQEVFLF